MLVGYWYLFSTLCVQTAGGSPKCIDRPLDAGRCPPSRPKGSGKQNI